MNKINYSYIIMYFMSLVTLYGDQDSHIPILKYEITAYDRSEISIHIWGDKIPAMIYKDTDCRINLSTPILTEVSDPQINSIKFKRGVFLDDNLNDIAYKSVSFLFGQAVRNGKNGETSFCRIEFLIYKSKLQEVFVYMPMGENTTQLLKSVEGKRKYFTSPSDTYSSIKDFLKSRDDK